jgi:hypothetical protein
MSDLEKMHFGGQVATVSIFAARAGETGRAEIAGYTGLHSCMS